MHEAAATSSATSRILTKDLNKLPNNVTTEGMLLAKNIESQVNNIGHSTVLLFAQIQIDVRLVPVVGGQSVKKTVIGTRSCHVYVVTLHRYLQRAAQQRN